MKQYSKENAEAFYNHYFDGEHYDVFRGDVGSFCTRRFIMKHVQHKQGNLLEVGTGFSSLMEDAQQFNCFGVDLSDSTIAMVKEVFARKGLQADMRVANAEALPFEDCFFDAIVSSHTLEHVENDAQAFKECARVLKKGGELLFFVPGRMSGLSTEEEFKSLGHYRMYNTQRFNALLAQVPSLKMTTILYPHKVHNLVWNRMKNLCRWVNYPVKKWILRDNKTYELRPFYKKVLLPMISATLNFFDSLSYKKEKNLLGAEFNVLVRFEKQ